MTKRAAQTAFSPRPLSAFNSQDADVVITGSSGPALKSRQPARELMDALLQTQAGAQQMREHLAPQFKMPQENWPIELVKNFMPVVAQALSGPADLRRLLRQLHNLGLIDRTSPLVKSTLIRSLPQGLRIRLAAIEWQILRDEILDRSHASENLTSCWQSARQWLAKRWHLDFLNMALWNTANEAHFFIPAPNRHFPAWAQAEWAIRNSPANDSLLAVLEAAPPGMSKVSLDLGHLDERTKAALRRCTSLRQLELMQETMQAAPAGQTAHADLSWLDQLSTLDTLVLGKNIQLEAIPPLTRSRLECLSLAAPECAAPLALLTGRGDLQALHLKLDVDAARGLPAGLHTLLLDPDRKLSDPEKKLLHALTQLEIKGSHFDLQRVLDRLPNPESLTLQDLPPTLDPLTAVPASPACTLRSLAIDNLPKDGKKCHFMLPLKSGRTLQQLSLSSIHTRAAVDTVLDIVNTLGNLSELSLGFARTVAVLKESAVRLVLAAIDRHPGLNKVALRFEVSCYDEEAGERLAAELEEFRRTNKSLMEFTSTINERSLSHFNWKY